MSIYKPLPDDHIRVIELQPGELHSPLVCDLVSVSTQPWPSYEAISYVWGDPNITEPICCNSESLQITMNLGHALRSLRYHDRHRRLWADAICINQKDIREREQQVRHMGSIYANATQVVGWLGLDKGSAKIAADFIASVSEGFNPDFEGGHGDHRFIKSYDSSHVSWGAVTDILDRALFERVWIIQELGLARQAVLRCGDIEIPWEKWIKSALLLGGWCHSLGKNLNARFSHIILIEKLFPKLQFTYSMHSSFATVLEDQRFHLATDPRDYIYAFLGHPTAYRTGSLIVEPDYKKSVQQLYTEVTVKLMETEGSRSLEILSTVIHYSDPQLTIRDMPSWVPDFRIRRQSGDQMHFFPSPHKKRFGSMGLMSFFLEQQLNNAALRLENAKKFSVDEQGTLRIEGFILDIVAEQTGNLSILNPKSNQFTEAQMAGMKRQIHSLAFDSVPQTWASDDAIRKRDVVATLTGGLSSLYDPSPRDSYDKFMADESHPPEVVGLDIFWPNRPDSFFKHYLFQYGSNRHFYCTKKGHLGIGPLFMRPGDICVWLCGGAVPFILRKVHDHHLFLGECYMPAFAHSETFDMVKRGELKKEVFEIH